MDVYRCLRYFDVSTIPLIIKFLCKRQLLRRNVNEKQEKTQ